MDSYALGWALDQRVGDPIARLLLIGLAGIRAHRSVENPEYEIAELAEYCEVDVPLTVEKLDHLRAGGFIDWDWGSSSDLITFELFPPPPPREQSPEIIAARRAVYDPGTFVYIMEGGGLLKVGISRHVGQRVAALSSPALGVTLLATHGPFPAATARQIESAAHAALQEFAAGREWFRVDLAKATQAVLAAIPSTAP